MKKRVYAFLLTCATCLGAMGGFAAPVQAEAGEEKKDDLMSHEEQSRFSYLRQLNALKLEQKKAVHEENFERAAQLRDEIHKLEEAHKEARESRKDSRESA